MSTQIYHSSSYNVYQVRNGYILHNIHKEFSKGHTHVQKYDTCMVMIKLLEKKRLPKSKSKHFIESLIRICNDKNYVNEIQKLTH